ncbi:MAG: TolB family protein [Gemmatimonadota bacterium]
MRSTLPILLLLAACSHSEPFTAPDEPLDGPLSPAVPVRLTYADGGPTAPVWTPDGDSIVYSYRRRGGGFVVNEEGCLAILPAAGGTIRREICSRSVFPAQSADVFDLPALSPGGRLAFFHDGQPVAPGTGAEAILVAPFATPSAYTLVRTFPFQADVFYVGAASLSWLDDGRLVFVGIAEEQFTPCGDCNPILVRYGRAVLAADVSTPGAVSVVPGTQFATSVTAGESPDIIYYTLANDARIYRQVLSSGATTTAHDFGAPAIARDVSFTNGRLAVIVDGSVPVYPDDIGTIQGPNAGGTPYVVVPGTGQAQLVPVPQAMWFRRPALSPDGSRIVAEGAHLQISAIGDGAGGIVGYDTVAGPSSIWRLAAP